MNVHKKLTKNPLKIIEKPRVTQSTIFTIEVLHESKYIF